MKRTSRLLRNRNRRAGAPPRLRPLPAESIAPVRPADHGIVDPVTTAADRLPLARAKALWLVGDWDVLAAVDEATLGAHPQRDRLALLSACAQMQRDQREQAAQRLRLALHWGCDPGLAARLLISGVHNSLARVAALKSDNPQLERHFGDALAITSDPDALTAAHTRAIREMADLGLMPQAVGLLQNRTAQVDRGPARPLRLEAEVTMLRSEVELLQHELTLALQRNASLFDQAPAEAAPRPADEGAAAWRARSTAQLGQDLWVLERTDHKRNGYFVEFGATDGVRLSNTFLLERHFGWRGICCEPNPRMFRRLQANRRCITVDTCVGARTGDRVEFVLAEEYGGMLRDIAADMHAAKRQAYAADPANVVQLETVSLEDLLLRHGAPHDIDYLSIDTEGSEYDILAAFPFDRWRIRLITVEHNFSATREPLRALLEGCGYRRREAQWDDWYELI